ncbi:MAG TPA: carboxypeptidase regulatory-like domain-containing protein, partial [Candidatus Eisenbacteria bacterium]|nr:carboxypeptidase regulatory-like domain-containing protein [Candidatus Eisenbacteria bacterium]
MRRIAILILLIFALAALVLARPYKTPVIDGTITGDGIDWDADDIAVDDPPLGADWGPNQIEQLWVTYDSLALYIGINYQVSNNAMIVYLAAGTGGGAQDVNGIDWYARNFAFADTVMADHLIANWDGGSLGIRRILDATATEDITSLCQNANTTKLDFFRNGEVRIPWDVIYGTAPGTVPPGSRVGVVAVIAGGDNWNGPSSAPWNPGMDGSGAKTTLANLHTIYIDRSGDGIPDKGAGSISGVITLDDETDLSTAAAVELFDEFDGSRIDSTSTSPGGGAYLFSKLRDGRYRVETSAPGYARIKRPGLVIAGGEPLTGIDILLTRAGKITGTVVYTDGPAPASAVTAYDVSTGDVAGDGTKVVPQGGGQFELMVPDGSYLVVADALGYIPDTLSAVITGSDSVHAGDLILETVKATRLVLIDDQGNELESVNTTVSFPDSGIFFYASALIEARDVLDRRDWHDVNGYLQQVDLRATKLNNTTPPRGDVTFYDPADTSEITGLSLVDGRGGFL